ncbi:hypothetical protein IW261DRAFT_1595428 [Armillaria novae-zelandiae]|uniref:Uncharacterized protein n=1 Tax=Armillaria novae-zelandiae TaxID=153914 RepID=A0AA39P0S3_9AGAR|nr:hypothetical protein IW261DRAFT_1595428 [Armillaria novae-zelandiae]
MASFTMGYPRSRRMKTEGKIPARYDYRKGIPEKEASFHCGGHITIGILKCQAARPTIVSSFILRIDTFTNQQPHEAKIVATCSQNIMWKPPDECTNISSDTKDSGYIFIYWQITPTAAVRPIAKMTFKYEGGLPRHPRTLKISDKPCELEKLVETSETWTGSSTKDGICRMTCWFDASDTSNDPLLDAEVDSLQAVIAPYEVKLQSIQSKEAIRSRTTPGLCCPEDGGRIVPGKCAHLGGNTGEEKILNPIRHLPPETLSQVIRWTSYKVPYVPLSEWPRAAYRIHPALPPRMFEGILPLQLSLPLWKTLGLIPTDEGSYQSLHLFFSLPNLRTFDILEVQSSVEDARRDPRQAFTTIRKLLQRSKASITILNFHRGRILTADILQITLTIEDFRLTDMDEGAVADQVLFDLALKPDEPVLVWRLQTLHLSGTLPLHIPSET